MLSQIKNRKTILIAHNYSENSFAAMSYHLAHHLAELGNKVVFISHKPFFKEMKTIEKGKGEIIVLSWSSLKRPTTIKDFVWFTKIYFRYKPQLLIGHFVGSNISIMMAKLLSWGKIKTFAYYHTLTSQIALDSKNNVYKSKWLRFRKRLFFIKCFVIG